MKVAIHSDLHLEFKRSIPNVSDADVVILAGDISNNIEDIEWLYQELQKQATVPVLFIPGNHEFYHNDFDEMNQLFKNMDNIHENFHFMNNRVLPIGKYDFIGSTLWTDFTLGKPVTEAEANAANAIADFKFICYKNKRFSTSDCVQLFRESVKELDDLLHYGSDREKIVFTHFAIAEKCSAEQYQGSKLSAYFTANVKYLIEKYSPKLWIYGHTHHNEDLWIGKTNVISNQKGYPNEGIDSYQADFIHEIHENMPSFIESIRCKFSAKFFDCSEENESNPDNGKYGFWKVEGLRHTAIVKTDSALNAIEKAKDIVQEWEDPKGIFIGEKLPEVFSIYDL